MGLVDDSERIKILMEKQKNSALKRNIVNEERSEIQEIRKKAKEPKKKKTAKDRFLKLEMQKALKKWDLMDESEKKVWVCITM